jgi:hypothetical protein
MPTKEQDNGIRTFIIIGAIVILLIAVPIGYSKWKTSSVTNKNTYNGFEFYEHAMGESLLWYTRIEVAGQAYDIPFYFHPREVEDVVIDPSVASRFYQGLPDMLYLTVPSDAGSYPVLAGAQIARFTGNRYNLFNIPTKGALQSPVEGLDQVIITCDDASESQWVFSFDQGDHNVILPDENNPYCVHFYSTNESEALRVANRFEFALLKIMN